MPGALGEEKNFAAVPAGLAGAKRFLYPHVGENFFSTRVAMAFFAPRDAETSLPCPGCGTRLHIARSCREVHIYCPACRAHYPIREYISRADAAMEQFLENVYCDRIE